MLRFRLLRFRLPRFCLLRFRLLRFRLLRLCSWVEGWLAALGSRRAWLRGRG